MPEQICWWCQQPVPAPLPGRPGAVCQACQSSIDAGGYLFAQVLTSTIPADLRGWWVPRPADPMPTRVGKIVSLTKEQVLKLPMDGALIAAIIRRQRCVVSSEAWLELGMPRQ